MLNTVADYFHVVRENSDYRKLYFGQIVSLLGDWFNYIAVQTIVFELTRSGFAAGLAIITSTLPAFFLTPLAGSLVDRFDRRKIMIAADLARALIALGMIMVRTADQVWLIYVLMGLLVVFGSFFNPASNAAIPNLVRKDQLYAANALSNSTWGAMLAIGALAGGVAIATVGQDAAFVINSASFFFSALMLFLIRKPFGERRASGHHELNPLTDFKEGMDYAVRRPQITALLLVKAGGSLAGGVILLLTVFSFQVFGAGAMGIGILQLARGVGILIGPLAAAPFVRGQISRAQWAICAGFLLAGAGYLLFGLTPGLLAGMAVVALAHVGWGSNWSLSATLLQRLTPDEVRGRIFSMDIGLFTLTSALSTFLTGAATDRLDPRIVSVALGGVFIVFGLGWGASVWLGQRMQPERWVKGSLQGASPGEEAWILD